MLGNIPAAIEPILGVSDNKHIFFGSNKSIWCRSELSIFAKMLLALTL